MGTASKVFNAIFRLGEICSAVIVLGILGHFLWVVSEASAYADSRIIYGVVVASIGTAFSLVTLLPFTFSFIMFPVDFALFVMWLVLFILLQTLTGTGGCNSVWYYDYWGFYWGGYWRSPTVIITGPWDIDWVGCGSWRAVLAFSFIASMIHLASAALGLCVTVKVHEEKKELRVRHQTVDKPHGGPMFAGETAPGPQYA